MNEDRIDIQVKNIEEDNNKAINTTSADLKYLARMDRKCVHNSINNINISDSVLIKKDFDINVKTKK